MSRSNAGTLSQLLRTDQMERQRERERERERQRSQSNHNNDNSSPAPNVPKVPSVNAGVEKSWPHFHQSYQPLPDEILAPPPKFICPSYLRSSRHVQRLAEKHESASPPQAASPLAATRPGKHVYYTDDNPPPAPLSASSSTVSLSKSPSSHGRPSAQDIERPPPLVIEQDLKKLPSAWSETDKCSGLEVSNAGTEVKFTGATKTSDEAAAIRSDHPIPKEVGLYYFEVTILSRGKEGWVHCHQASKTHADRQDVG